MSSQTRSVALKAYAKVNLFLNVARTRPDGYHDLEMFNAKIDLFDDVRIDTDAGAAAGIIVRSNDKYFENGDNLIVRIAQHMLASHAPGGNVTITIDKRIPAGAGLGGNSADAATVLQGMDRLFGWNIGTAGLAAIALRFGADIPYCLHAGPAFVFGIGDKILPVGLDLSECGILVVNPRAFVATESAFAAWDAGDQHQVSTTAIAAAVAAGKPQA
ncbi:MAG: 4-(cytidine 5'-diphospho)-2-C-methyl-D-erythritol kinase, partial [bacterium]